MKTEVNPFLTNAQETVFPPHWMVYWKMSWFVHIFPQQFHKVPKVYALSRSYFDCWKTLDFVHFLCTNCALGALRIYQSLNPKKNTGCFRIDYRVTLYLSLFSSTLILKAVIAHCALQMPRTSGSFYSLTTQWIVNDHTINISQTVTAVYMSMIYRSLPDINAVARFIMDLWLLHNTRSHWLGKRSLHQQINGIWTLYIISNVCQPIVNDNRMTANRCPEQRSSTTLWLGSVMAVR